GSDGGGVPDGGIPDGINGSRLRMQHMVGGDGSRYLFSWLDKMTGWQCSYSIATDNEMRCLPAPFVADPNYQTIHPYTNAPATPARRAKSGLRSCTPPTTWPPPKPRRHTAR